jgi:hypothetical protein
MSTRSYHKGRIAWDERRARHLTSEGEQALRSLRTKIHRLQAKTHEASDGLSARVEVLMGEKRVAYEAGNIERYEAAIRAIVHQAQAL